MAEQTKVLSYAEALNAAYKEEMRRDKGVVLWGEDLISMKGVYMTTAGIFEEFGPDRIHDTPIVEVAIAEMAIGAALTGLRPIANIMTAGFLTVCMDALFMKMGALRQEYGYHGSLPIVVDCRSGGGRGLGPDHCSSTEALLIHSAGLKVVLPSTPYDAKGLMKSAIRDDDPVIFMSHGELYFAAKQAIPAEEYLIPLGEADIKREGNDITIVAYSGMVAKVLAAAEALSKEGISVELVDPRTLVPLDIDAIIKSVKKTGRLLIVHEAMKRGGVAGEIAFRVSETAPDVVAAMKTPIRRLAAKNLVLPHSGPELEAKLTPQVDDIVKTVKEMV